MNRFRHRKKCKGCHKLMAPSYLPKHKCKAKLKVVSA